MFEGKKLGGYIQFLRKSRGMTQQKLADALGVSPQAVSNWERGESMPDISILSEVAKALGTSVDRMLTAAEDFTAEAYEKLSFMKEPEDTARDTASESSEKPEASYAEELKPPKVNMSSPDIVAAIKDVLREALSGISERTGGLINLSGGIADKIERAIGEAAADAIDESADKDDEEADLRDSMEEAKRFIRDAEFELHRIGDRSRRVSVRIRGGERSEEDSEWGQIMRLAPFASQEMLDTLISSLDFDVELSKIVSIAPFLSSKTLSGLVAKAIDGGGGEVNWSMITGLAPFINGTELERLIVGCAAPKNIKQITGIAPFISSATLRTLISQILTDSKDLSGIVHLAPFLQSNDLEQVIGEHVKDAGSLRLAELAPFLDHGAIDRLILKAIKSKN